MTDKFPVEILDPASSIAYLNHLLRLWHAHDGRADTPMLDGTSLPGMAIHIQVEHIAEQTESVVELIRHHNYLTTAPLIRVIMECSVNALWWAANPTAVRASMHEGGRQRAALLRGLSGVLPDVEFDIEGLEDVMRAYEVYAAHEARLFKPRCEAIPGGGWIYPYYRLLSEASHGGVSLLQEYMTKTEATEGNPDGLALVQRPHYRDLDVALTLHVVMFAMAFAAWDQISPAHPDRAALHGLADELGFGVSLRTALGQDAEV